MGATEIGAIDMGATEIGATVTTELLEMGLVKIGLLVYPGAYPTHGVWAAVLLLLMAKGPGSISLDHWISKKISR